MVLNKEQLAAFGAWVRERRRELGDPPVREMAQKASAVHKMTHQWWWSIEQGEGPKSPSEQLLRGIAVALERPYREVWCVVYGSMVPVEMRAVTLDRTG